MSPLLTTALALLAAFSQPDYQAVTQLPPPLVANLSVTNCAAKTWASIRPETVTQPCDKASEWRIGPVAGYGATVYTGSQPDVVIVNSILTHPAAVAAVLAHEGAEIREGWPGSDCGEHEMVGQREGLALFQWMDSTFGPPVLTGSDWMARATAENAVLRGWKANGC